VNTLHLGAFVPFFILVAGSLPGIGMAEMPSPASSKIQPGNFEGGTARQISSPWVTPTIVPHLGGHALEVTLGNHPYRFVKMQRKGKSFPSPPLWPLPEGSQDTRHWPGPISDLLEDGNYDFKALSQDAVCAVRLEGPADPRAGLQSWRDQPEQRFA
jgi:hypothetical protein